jgi:DNA-binding PucR family transcriptional regulator
LERRSAGVWPEHLPLAIGEPSQGPAGWRLTHRQAQAALLIALRSSEAIVRYSDVAVLASMLQDELLTASLRQLYLEPLAVGRDKGRALRETLRAYFAAERNISSTAAALGVNRHTVTNRLRVIEDRLECPLGSCAMEIDAALRLENLLDKTAASPRRA